MKKKLNNSYMLYECNNCGQVISIVRVEKSYVYHCANCGAYPLKLSSEKNNVELTS